MSYPKHTPRIVRVEQPPWMVAIALGCATFSTAVGYMAGARAFRPPSHGAEQPTNTAPDTQANDEDAQAPATPTDASTTAAPAPHAPAVPVRVTRVDVQACGDGDELDTVGERCQANPAIEQFLRAAMTRLGDCPAALIAGQNPAQVLSLGLRVDFTRRLVTPTQGRASSIRDPLTFVACARGREALGSLEPLWSLPHSKNRYMFILAMRFGPVPSGATTPEPVAPVAPVAPTAPIAPIAPVAPTATPDPNDPTLSLPVTVFMGGAPMNHEAVHVTWSRALIRAEPRNGAVITRLAYNTQLTLEARSGSWYRVRWPRGTGWVFADAIGLGSSTPATP
ncbi:MAG: SH3 domain-containing protein [Deltaproteobacteria bacterium]|nr:SH3 domain-containing protein [Deltaproteobacteria bacterium]